MSQRYFITAESTYEDLRISLNTLLAYPNALGKSVFQTALQAPRDSFRRVLLAVDTAIPGYAAINSAIQALLDSDAMEELDQATYLAAVASAASGGGGGGASTWDELTGKPTEFTPSAHKATHATGGSDALSAADIGAAAASHAHAASAISSGTLDIARIPTGQTGTTVPLGDDARFSDSRTPTAHKTSHQSGGADELALSAAQIASGSLSDARLSDKANASINLYLWSAFR